MTHLKSFKHFKSLSGLQKNELLPGADSYKYDPMYGAPPVYYDKNDVSNVNQSSSSATVHILNRVANMERPWLLPFLLNIVYHSLYVITS